MPIITLTTDFGTKDHFVSAVKGQILNELDDVHIVDISHQISPFNILEAAYILENSYKNFPRKSIHIVGIDSELTPQNEHIALALDDHYFICANNGLISLLTSKIKPTKVVEINLPNTPITNFPTRDVFVKVAAHIARGGTLDVIGKPIKHIRQIRHIAPSLNDKGNQLIAHIIYIDNYGNAITNVTKTYLESLRKERNIKIEVRGKTFTTIKNRYSEIVDFNNPDTEKDEGRAIALYNSSGYLEIAIYKSNNDTVGGSSSLFGLSQRDTITISFL